MSEFKNTTEFEHGSVSISDSVFRTIANIAAEEIRGVDGMSGRLTDDFVEIFGVKNHMKGVKIDSEGDAIIIKISIIVNYGTKILDISKAVQHSVKQAVESMTGLQVNAVNIDVVGIAMPIGDTTEKSKKKN